MPGLNSIDGINSQLDTTGIIDTIMQYERRPAVLLENQQAEKTNIITTLKALQAKMMALDATLKALARSATFENGTVAMSEDGYLTATPSGRVGVGAYDVQVLSMARNHQLASQGFSDESLSSFGTGTINITVGDGSLKEITIDGNNNSLVGIKEAINNANAGVTASIVNDGSSSNSYRLLLSADKTGQANSMTVTSSLTGGNNLNFSTGSFDAPEIISTAASTTTTISLGNTAAFTGSTNKIYSFTVKGTGVQTIGGSPIEVEWTDGTNSGSIFVTQADQEIDLLVEGSEGLKLSFSAGDLTAGDTFQVASFAPLLQEASDARIAFGPVGGNGSPIQVVSDTNNFKNVIPGVDLNILKETLAGETITINTDVDIDGIKAKINEFIKAYNDVSEFIDDQNKYDVDAKEAGTLFGDYTVQRVQHQLSRAMGDRIEGIESKYNQLYSVGIRTLGVGRLSIANSSRLEEALRENLDDVIKLFTNSANTSSSGIEFMSASAETVAGDQYDVNITQVATHGYLEGTSVIDPSTTNLVVDALHNRFKFKVDGVTSDDIIIDAMTYTSTAQLVGELQAKIDADENVGARGVTVEWVDDGDGSGHLLLTGSTWGTGSKVEVETGVANSGLALLGLADAISTEGIDVAGTINGEEAEGLGQFLTGNEDNETTDGLKLRITLTEAQLGDGAEGTATVTKGIATRLSEMVQLVSRSGDGTIDRRIKTYETQVTDLTNQIEAFDARLARRRESLFMQYYEMERALGELSSQNQYLTNQLAGINSNWGFGRSNR